MRRLLVIALLASTFLSASAFAAAPAHIGRYTTTPDDLKAINKVIEDFQAGIRQKNPKALSALLLNSNILFASPIPPEGIAMAREKFDSHFDGLPAGGYTEFARFVMGTKGTPEEKFYNIKITQDKNLAWVMFDYEFLIDGKAQNYGVEAWQMIKVAEGSWKIASVMWTMNRPPQ